MSEFFLGASPVLLLEWWKPAPGLEGRYEISNVGNLRNIKTGTLRKLCLGRGYPQAVIMVDRKMKCFVIHKLVAGAFVGPRPPGYTVNHKDLNKSRNWASNLEYLTNLDNIRHAFENGAHNGKKYPLSERRKPKAGSGIRKLTPEQWDYILNNPDRLSQTVMAKRLGVDPSWISTLCRRSCTFRNFMHSPLAIIPPATVARCGVRPLTRSGVIGSA